jgi:hypothetical protein
MLIVALWWMRSARRVLAARDRGHASVTFLDKIPTISVWLLSLKPTGAG